MSTDGKLSVVGMPDRLPFANSSAQLREALYTAAFGREPLWAQTMAKALDAIEMGLRCQRALADDSTLWFIDPNRTGPIWHRQMEATCDGHAELLANVEVLGKEIRRAAFVFGRQDHPAFRKARIAVPDLGAMSLQAKRILEHLDPSQAVEIKTVPEAQVGVAG